MSLALRGAGKKKKKKKKKATAHSSEFGLKGWSIQGWSHEKANDKLS